MVQCAKSDGCPNAWSTWVSYTCAHLRHQQKVMGVPRQAFSFGLQNNNRVTIVGERTGGGGHWGGTQPLSHGFQIWVPVGKTYNPKTGKGWEAEGIKPNHQVPYDQALEETLKRIRNKKTNG